MLKNKIKTEVHTHTLVSDHAYNTLLEMITAAAGNGTELLAVTNHGPALDGDGAHPWHFGNLKAIPRKASGIYVVRGAEANLISLDGTVDLPQETLKVLDWVIASVHNPCIKPGTVEENTNMYIRALENPLIDALGHSGTPNFPYDIDAVLETAKGLNKVIELNNHSFVARKTSIENCKKIARRCAELKVNVVISTDAHSIYELANTENAWAMAMEAGICEEQIINLTAERFIAYLCERRGLSRDEFEKTAVE